MFVADGRKAILFYYQEADTPISSKQLLRQLSTTTDIFPLNSGDLVSSGVAPSLSKQRTKRVIATDGNSEPLVGTCVFFLKPNNSKQLTTSNIADVREDTNSHRLYELHFVSLP